MNLKKLIFSGLSVIAMQFGALEAFCDAENWKFELDLESGYRTDMIEETQETIDTALILPYSSVETRYKALSSIQLGGRAYAGYCNWVVKGIGHYGWILDGRFDQDRALDGKSVRGNTYDALGGIGYTFCVCDCFALTPLVGYSYDHQQIRVHHLVKEDPILPLNTIHSIDYHASWYGPWVGFDLCYDATKWCGDLSFTAGYEFHYGRARTKTLQHLLPTVVGAPGPEFGFSTKQRDMLGHVFRFDTQLRLWEDWYGGLNQTISYWDNTRNSSVHFAPGTVSGLTPTQVQRDFRLNWYSYSITVSLGKAF